MTNNLVSKLHRELMCLEQARKTINKYTVLSKKDDVELLTLCYECEQLLDLQPFCLLFRREEEKETFTCNLNAAKF